MVDFGQLVDHKVNQWPQSTVCIKLEFQSSTSFESINQCQHECVWMKYEYAQMKSKKEMSNFGLRQTHAKTF